jgi:hypothetical protein
VDPKIEQTSCFIEWEGSPSQIEKESLYDACSHALSQRAVRSGLISRVTQEITHAQISKCASENSLWRMGAVLQTAVLRGWRHSSHPFRGYGILACSTEVWHVEAHRAELIIIKELILGYPKWSPPVSRDRSSLLTHSRQTMIKVNCSRETKCARPPLTIAPQSWMPLPWISFSYNWMDRTQKE